MLVERDEHLKYLDHLLNDCLMGEGRVVLIEGSAAIGKTALLHNFAERAAGSDALFLNATCARAEHSLPFGVLGQLFQSTNLPADVTDRTGRLLAEGAAKAANIGSTSDAVDPEMVQIFHSLCLALLELAADTPILIGIDDVHYADIPSLLCLLHLVRRSGSARILVVLTEDRTLQPPHSPFRAELLRQPHFHRLGLAPLSPDGVDHFLMEHLHDTVTARHVAPEFAAASGGNPLLLRALVEDYRMSGEVCGQGYGLALLGCLHRGESITFRVAQALAALGEGASPQDLGRLAGTDADAVERVVQAMTASGLLDQGRFRHPVVRSAVLDDLSDHDRSDLHRRAARQLHDQGAPATTIARHLIAAGHAVQEAWAAGLLLKASEQAVLDNQLEAAADCLRLAGQSLAGESGRAGVRAKLAQVEWQIDPSIAEKHLSSLTAAARADELAGSDRIMLIRHLLWHGRVDEAVDVFTGMRDADNEQGGTTAELRDLEYWLAFSHPSLARRRRLPARPANHGDALATPNTDPWLQAAAMLADALARGRCHEAVERAVQVLRDLHLSRTTSWGSEAALLALQVLTCADKIDIATEWCDRLRAEADTRQSPTWQAMFAGARAEIAVRQGDLVAAADHARAAITHISPKAWGAAIGLPLDSLIVATTRMGRYEEAGGLLTEPVPEATFDSRYGLRYLYARGHYYLATNHHHAALADFLSCGELMRGWGIDVAELVPWRTGAAEAWLRLGNRDRAKQLIYDQMAQPGGNASRVRGLALRLLAAISPPSRRPQPLTEALDLLEDCGDRFEQARVLADLSRAYHTLNNNRRARMVFRRALHVGTMCEAQPLCQELLSVPSDLSGAATESEEPPEDGIASLTNSERRVASLAVIGYTNLEIAAKVYVTPSTVEQHLTRVYKKLGVKRKDLPVELGAGLIRTGR